MVMIKDQIIVSHKLIEDQLIPGGWRRRISGLYTKEMGGDVLGWLGLNRTTHKTGGVLLINPVVGIRNQKLEQQVAQLSGIKFHPYIPPSIGGNVGYMMPVHRFTEWTFSPELNTQEVASGLVKTIQDYGMSFIQANIDLRQLLHTMLHAKYGIRHELVYRIPCVYMMLGQFDAAKSELDRHLAELVDADYPAATDYRRFAIALQRAIDNTNG